jgi:predicted ArsR family transcriptional regulator
VDRLSLFRLLADRSRYAIYQLVAQAQQPLSTTEIADRLDLHTNTVRLHLEKMREAGLVLVSTDRHGSVGRPQHRWATVPQAASLGLEPGFRILALLLAEVAAEQRPAAPTVVAVGSRRGRERARTRPAAGGEPIAACLQAVMEELTDLGFDPSLEADRGSRAVISFTHCPFRDVALLYPDLVCQLHRGLTEGILSAAAAANPGVQGSVESFASLVDPDPCRVEVAILPDQLLVGG